MLYIERCTLSDIINITSLMVAIQFQGCCISSGFPYQMHHTHQYTWGFRLAEGWAEGLAGNLHNPACSAFYEWLNVIGMWYCHWLICIFFNRYLHWIELM